MSEETTTEPKSEVMALSVPSGGQKTTTIKLANLFGNRPIEASNLVVLSTFGFNRPILASDMKVSSTITLSGNRPIAVSHLQISETCTVIGNRPVASNDIDDSAILMGYLD